MTGSTHESFDEWYRSRHELRFQADEDEIQEWSRFMGYRVTPMEICELRVSLRQKLNIEGSGLSDEEADQILEEWKASHES